MNNPGESTMKDTNASIITAIKKSGGISKNASVRNIKLKKLDGKEYNFDLYDFLYKGKMPKEFKYLSDGDIIFVPLQGSTVMIDGPVKRPGVYEVKSDEFLSNIIDTAGGFLPGSSSTIRIIRIKSDTDEKTEQRVTEYDTSKDKNVKIKDGDTIIVNLLPEEQLLDMVFVEGNGIKTPGEYNFIQGLTVNDLIEEANGVYPDVYKDRIDIVRTNNDFSTSVINLNLNKIQKMIRQKILNCNLWID